MLPAEQLAAVESQSSEDELDEVDKLKAGEMRARDEQAEDYDKMWMLNLFSVVEIPLTLKYLGLEQSHLLLEAGCGTGRMTREFAKHAKEVVSVDFSWESLQRCKRKLTDAGVTNVHLLQADICRLPFASNQFDRVVSCQVLEHVPQAHHQNAARDLGRVLRKGGQLALSAYQYNIFCKMKHDKSGFHDGGIPYYRFDKQELRELLSTSLRVERMTGALAYHYLARCRKESAS
jgi:ubiquinone/menaquinone biosynthesis C-methylase UbiE